MRYVHVLEGYTTAALGVSILTALFLLPTIPIGPEFEGRPLFLVHPFFVLEMLLTLSPVILWFTAMLTYLRRWQGNAIAFAKKIVQNLPLILLVLLTAIAAISGGVVFSETVHFEDLRADTFNQPSIFNFIYGLGTLFAEEFWIIVGSFESMKYLKRNLYQRRRKQRNSFCLA